MKNDITWMAAQPLLGGLALGCERALGSRPVACYSYQGIGNDQHFLNYYESQGQGIPYFILDGGLLSFAKTFETQDMEKQFYELVQKGVDVVSGVPVCSALSGLNSVNKSAHSESSKARGSDGEQNNNLLGLAEFTLEKVKPKAYIFENAPGLYSSIGAPIRAKLYEIAKKCEYSITFVNTSTFLHGIPQKRNRAFCIFWKSKTAPIMGYYNDKPKSLQGYLDEIDPKSNNIPEKLRDFDNVFHKYLRAKFGDTYREEMVKNGCNTVAQVIQKFNDWDMAKALGTEREIKQLEHFQTKIAAGKNYWDTTPLYLGPDYAPAITGKTMYNLIHPTEERYYSTRELMKMMGLPDDFNLVGGEKNAIHLTQNVPVNTSRDMHLEIVKFLNNELPFSGYEIVMHNNIKRTWTGIKQLSSGFNFTNHIN